jgi:hypothetical protein
MSLARNISAYWAKPIPLSQLWMSDIVPRAIASGDVEVASSRVHLKAYAVSNTEA